MALSKPSSDASHFDADDLEQADRWQFDDQIAALGARFRRLLAHQQASGFAAFDANDATFDRNVRAERFPPGARLVDDDAGRGLVVRPRISSTCSGSSARSRCPVERPIASRT